MTRIEEQAARAQRTLERLNRAVRELQRFEEQLPARCAIAQAIGDALFGWMEDCDA